MPLQFYTWNYWFMTTIKYEMDIYDLSAFKSRENMVTIIILHKLVVSANIIERRSSMESSNV